MALGDSGDVIDATRDERGLSNAIRRAATLSLAGRDLDAGLLIAPAAPKLPVLKDDGSGIRSGWPIGPPVDAVVGPEYRGFFVSHELGRAPHAVPVDKESGPQAHFLFCGAD